MMDKENEAASVDEYIKQYSPLVQNVLQSIRNTIREAAPESVEKISYRMPAYEWHGILVYYGAHQNHIGFYPTASGIEAFHSELSDYRTSRGAVQFPLDQPIPYALISKIVKYRSAENMRKWQEKQTEKSRRDKG